MATALISIGDNVRDRNDLVSLENSMNKLAESNGERIDRWMISFPSADRCVDVRELIGGMSRGDALYVNDVTSLGSNFKELISALSEAVRRGVRIYGARDGYTNSGVEDSGTYLQALEHMSSAYRLLVSSKTKAALSGKKDAGEKLGRPDGSCVKMRILIKNKQHIRSALENGESISSLCSRYNVSRSTFRRFLKHTGASVDQSNQRKNET